MSVTKLEDRKEKEPATGLDLLREPFPANLIGKLPKPTKQQTDEVKADFKKGIRCTICGGWHHPKVVHLDYVGHAALTDRLLDSDPKWTWEPLSFTEEGLPRFDNNGGLWIRLTVCGVTRLGYGDAQGKGGGDAIKEAIGDALRNAGMRFGAALELWHKGDLHAQESNGVEPLRNDDAGDTEYTPQAPFVEPKQQMLPKGKSRDLYAELQADIESADSVDALKVWATQRLQDIESLPPDWRKNLRGQYAEKIFDFEHGPDLREMESEHVQ